MFYLKSDSRVLVGNCAIPDNLIAQYIGTLCCQVESEEKKYSFVDISLTRQQMIDLADLIHWYLEYTDKYPPVQARPLVDD
ncbi:hypothetical protein QUB37_07320 [Microcoleus sp. AT3-A2]|uniref:hypothetical protein n=1 Tax=Microcoleus sp. AT3-A2 TaxID=2818610 RepID=UPI002FD0C6E8